MNSERGETDIGEETRGGSGRPSVVVYDRGEFWRLGPSYRRAFEELGWRAHLLDTREREDDLRWWLRSRIGHRLTRRILAARRIGSAGWNHKLASSLEDLSPDLFLIMNGTLLMPETVRRVRESGTRIAVVYADDPTRGSPNYHPEFVPVAREADLVFIWSRRLKERLEKEEDLRARYLPFGWDPAVFPKIHGRSPAGAEVVFVGGWDRRRERWLEPVARRFDLEVWGPDYWQTRTKPGSPVRECWQGRALRGREAAEAVARADIALNVFREQNLPDGTNMRTFEVPGAGGFLLSHDSSGAREVFPGGEAGAYFDTREEMLAQLERYLSSPTDRARIATAAHEIVRAGHRYVDRARAILRDLGLPAAGRSDNGGR